MNISRDGTTMLYFDVATASWYTESRSTGARTAVTAPRSACREYGGGQISPDASHIVWIGGCDATITAVVSNATGSNVGNAFPVNLSAVAAPDAPPLVWSPDGTHFAFTALVSCSQDRFASSVPEVHVVNIDGSGDHRVGPYPCATSGPTHESTRPSWMPDGRSLGFTVGAENIGDQLHVAALADVDGGNYRELFGMPSTTTLGTLSPDGTQFSLLKDGVVLTTSLDGRCVSSVGRYDTGATSVYGAIVHAWVGAGSGPRTCNQSTLPGVAPPAPAPAGPAVGMTARPQGDGYWVAYADGSVTTGGSAEYFGSAAGLPLAAPVVGMAATMTGRGYWLVARDGGIFSFGDAAFRGSTGAMRLNKPIVGMAADPDGDGYWFVAADGGVFSFDAPFFGSTGAIQLAQPIVAMAATVTGHGYWLAARDGGIFTFGDAAFSGSAVGFDTNDPVVGMAGDPDGVGYWLVAHDGPVYALDAPYFGWGSCVQCGGAGRNALPSIAIVADTDQHAYWVLISNGDVVAPTGGAHV
jgi:hypothetical protein